MKKNNLILKLNKYNKLLGVALAILLQLSFGKPIVAQNLITPDNISGAFFVSGATNLTLGSINNSGLSSPIPTTVAQAINTTHVNPAFTSASYIADGSSTTTPWVFGFNAPQNIQGMVLWQPCATPNGGDAPFNKVVLTTVSCGITFTDTVTLGLPSGSAKIVNFPSPKFAITSITLNIIESWVYNDPSGSASCDPTVGWTSQGAGSVNSNYNVMLGEIKFIEATTNPSVLALVDLIVSNESKCNGCDTLTFNVVDNSDNSIFASFTIKNCPDTFPLCLDSLANYDLVGSNGIIFPNAITNGTVNYPNGQAPFEFWDGLGCCSASTDSQYVHINSNITYTSDQIWDNKYYIDDNVIVTVDGAVLDITNVDVVFGECAGIDFINGAYLRSNNSVFRPCAVDGTWRGIQFDGSQGQSTFDNIINQSTFKNAAVALYFIDGADGVITDNLFSNCNNGVRVENNNDFNHSITGNRFVTEQFYPEYDSCYAFTNNTSSFGIISTATKFSQQVSQNEFVNSKGTQLEAIGIHQTNGGGIFTSNTFTDYTSSITSISPQFYTGIENNTIEINMPGINSFVNSTSIFIDGANGPLVEVNNNEINNNENQFPTFMAIGARSSTNISISKNEIEGFNYGIIVWNQSHKYQITENRIQNTLAIGIIAVSVGNDQNFITCNEIKMKTFNNTIGIHHFNMSSTSEITSNCITDCSTPINLVRFGGATLPKVRNNYLYNYNNVGINVVGYSGNIGTVNDPGMNTLWSNDNNALDIQSNTTITVADNFGMFNIGFPQVQVTSNNPYHSTASCGNQIFNLPSQGNLNTDYSCDHIQSVDGFLIGSGGTFTLANSYLSKLSNSANQYNDANMILATYKNADVNTLNDIITNTSLTANQIALLKYHFYYRSSDYTNAELNITQFAPENVDETDYKTLRMYDIDVINNDWSILTTNDIQTIENIKNKKSIEANFAVSLLNNTATYRDYIFDVPDVPNITKTTNVKNIENVESYLNIYPNPSSSTVYVELINSSLGGEIQLFDIAGKLVENYGVNIVAGRLEIDIHNLNDGIYFITLTNPENGFSQKGKIIKVAN